MLRFTGDKRRQRWLIPASGVCRRLVSLSLQQQKSGREKRGAKRGKNPPPQQQQKSMIISRDGMIGGSSVHYYYYYYYCALITLKRSNISDINDSSSSTLQSVKCTSGCVTHGSNNTNWSIATGDIIGDIVVVVVLYVLSAAAAATAEAGISYLAITATAAHGTRQQQLGKQQQQWC